MIKFLLSYLCLKMFYASSTHQSKIKCNEGLKKFLANQNHGKIGLLNFGAGSQADNDQRYFNIVRYFSMLTRVFYIVFSHYLSMSVMVAQLQLSNLDPA